SGRFRTQLVDGTRRALLFDEERARAHRGGEGMTLPGAMLNFISRRDHRLMRHVNRWPAPRWIRLWALCATRGGDGWLWYGIGAVILLFGGPMRFRAVGAAASRSIGSSRRPTLDVCRGAACSSAAGCAIRVRWPHRLIRLLWGFREEAGSLEYR